MSDNREKWIDERTQQAFQTIVATAQGVKPEVKNAIEDAIREAAFVIPKERAGTEAGGHRITFGLAPKRGVMEINSIGLRR